MKAFNDKEIIHFTPGAQGRYNKTKKSDSGIYFKCQQTTQKCDSVIGGNEPINV